MINSLVCLNLPSEHVWLQRYELPQCKDVLRLPALKKAVIMDSSHNLAKAKVQQAFTSQRVHLILLPMATETVGRGRYSGGQKKPGARPAVPPLLYCCLSLPISSLIVHPAAMQLAKTGKVSDLHAGNEYWKEIMDNPSLEWDGYEEKYRPSYMNLMHELKYYQDSQVWRPLKYTCIDSAGSHRYLRRRKRGYCC